MNFCVAKGCLSWNAAINALFKFEYSFNFNYSVFPITATVVYYYYAMMHFPSLFYQGNFRLILKTNLLDDVKTTFLSMYFHANKYPLHHFFYQFKFTFSCNTEGLC